MSETAVAATYRDLGASAWRVPRWAVFLAATHVTLAVFFGWFAEDSWPPSLALIVFIGVVYSQTTLLGFFGALANGHWTVRLLGLLLGTACTAVLFAWGLDDSFDVLKAMFIVCPVSLVTLVLLGVRHWGTHLVHRSSPVAIRGVREGLQFSIWHLMVVTAVIACILGIGRTLATWIDGAHDGAAVIVFTLCFVTVGLAGIWAALGTAFVSSRTCVVMLLAAASGALPPSILDRSSGPLDYALWCAITATHAVFLIASLLVVRLGGYRLVARTTADVPPSSQETAMSYEVEQKFRAADLSALATQIEQLGGNVQPPVEQVDRYFAHPSRDFGETDEAFRIRQVGAANCVTYKGPKIDQTTKTRREIELPLPNGADYAEQFAEMLVALGFEPVAAVQKHRREVYLPWEGQLVTIALDEVERVGDYVELELQADESALDGSRSCLASLADQLALTDVERRSYLELLLAEVSLPPREG